MHGKTMLFFGAFAPVLSLDALMDQPTFEGAASFDIPDSDSPSVFEQISRAEAIAAVGEFVEDLADRDREIVRRIFWLVTCPVILGPVEA